MQTKWVIIKPVHGQPFQIPKLVIDGIFEVLIHTPSHSKSGNETSATSSLRNTCQSYARVFFSVEGQQTTKTFDMESGELVPLVNEDMIFRLARVDMAEILAFGIHFASTINSL